LHVPAVATVGLYDIFEELTKPEEMAKKKAD